MRRGDVRRVHGPGRRYNSTRVTSHETGHVLGLP
ncbi:snapalysin family zinc-dependent metalloprotease, partial [Streptomyces sp. NPDC006341]